MFCINRYILIAILITLFTPGTGHSQMWTPLTAFEAEAYTSIRSVVEPNVAPTRSTIFSLDPSDLDTTLQDAPVEQLDLDINLRALPRIITLPMPNGSTQAFEFLESSIMHPDLQAQFPQIRTYIGQGIDDPAATLRFDWTPIGFHAQILSPNGNVYVDPYFEDDDLYASYYKKDAARKAPPFQCLVDGSAQTRSTDPQQSLLTRSGSQLRTYRLAVATTIEYTAVFGNATNALAAVTTTINRVTGIYETELSVRMQLIANNINIIHTAADSYSNDDGVEMLSQNQTRIDQAIGSANYDIGHVFSTGGGGVAGLGVVCEDGSKARGVTGSPSPTGDAFDVDFVAHEIGHQFSATHTFNGINGSCSGFNRTASTAYEPGSGSTIMGYAGICENDNLQANSDPYFHHENLAQILNHVASSCAVVTGTGNNEPTADAGSNYVIPVGTPFTLTGSATDADFNDTLTYSWEQRDLGNAVALGTDDNGSIPLFRVFPPTTSPTRTFPRMSTILSNGQSDAERLPTFARNMKFRLTVRDNDPNPGGFDTDDMLVTVNTSGSPFSLTSPNSGTFAGASDVTWTVGATNQSPISVAFVDILLSTDGGVTFDVLASSTPNDGIHSITLPDIDTSLGRVMVRAVGNIFFDVSNENFIIGGGSLPTNASSTDVPKVISDNTTIISTLEFPDALTIADIDVTLDISHTYDEDLTVTLKSPSNTTITLFSGVGSDGQNFTNTTLDDDGTTNIANGFAPFIGTFSPATPLSSFNSENSKGTWTLSILDNATLDEGTLNSWSVSITGAPIITLLQLAWVNFDYTGPENGTLFEPFNSLGEALAVMKDDGTIFISGGSTPETPTIDQRVTLVRVSGIVQIGTP